MLCPNLNQSNHLMFQEKMDALEVVAVNLVASIDLVAR